MSHIESVLLTDPQRCREKRCSRCGACVYPPEYHCIRCERSAP